MILEAVFEAMFEGWALAVEWVAERFGRASGMAVFFLPWIVIALTIWLVVVHVRG
jgi:hypothetical protein